MCFNELSLVYYSIYFILYFDRDKVENGLLMLIDGWSAYKVTLGTERLYLNFVK